MKKFFIAFLITLSNFVLAQKGPGGVGSNDGSTSLKIWYSSTAGVFTTGSSVDSLINLAGLPELNISESGTQRPTLVGGAVNGFPELSFSGTNRLRTGLTLTPSNFVTNQASTFIVCRADNTSQTSSVYTTDPLVGSTRFTNHIPWSGQVYYDIGTCCSNDARIQVGGLTSLDTYSYWSYDANPVSGKQLYRNGVLLQDRPNTTPYTSHATHRFNIGANTSGTNGFAGDITEVIVFTSKINSTQRIIIENYLSAKYNIPSLANDLYDEDNSANGNYDFDVAGIGRTDATNLHDDAQGTGIVRIFNPTDLGNNEYFIWGHNNGIPQAIEFTDVPPTVLARFDRVWRASEVNTALIPVEVGAIDIQFDLTGLGPVTASDLRLLVDTDNDGLFNDETPILGATGAGGAIFRFAAVSAIQNNMRFTLATINVNQTPLPIELVNFYAQVVDGERKVALTWQTASEMNNDYFTLERSINGIDWEEIQLVDGAGNSSSLNNYAYLDTNPYTGTSYYRLKQTDFNGSYTYSQIRIVKIGAFTNSEIVIYPNPTDNEITVTGNESELAQILIFNTLGQEVSHVVRFVQVSNNSYLIDLSGLSSGMYYLKTKTTTSKVHKR